MQLKGFYINGYKCLKNVFIPLENGLSVIVGPNDVGKSSIIEALDLFNRCIIKRGPRYIEAGKFYLKQTDTITIAAIFNDHVKDTSKYYALVIDIRAKYDVAEIRDYRENIDIKMNKKVMAYNFSENRLEEIEEKSYSPSDLSEQLPYMIFLLSRRRLEDTYDERKIKENLIKPIIDKLRKNNEFRENIDSLRMRISSEMNNKLSKLNSRLSILYGIKKEMIPDVRIQLEKGLNWEFMFKEHNLLIPLTEKGEGLQNIVLLELYRLISEESSENRKNYLLIIDELENHLYPRFIHAVLCTILKLSKREYYILLITHSPIIINNIPLKHIYFVKKREDKSVILPVMKVKNLAEVNRELDVKLIDILGVNFIILVEGKYDKKFIEYLLNNKMEEEAYNISIIDMGGAQRTCYYAEVYSKIAKDYSEGKVLIILDGDDEGKNAEKDIKDKLYKYIENNILYCYVLPDRMTIEDALLREDIIEIVRRELKKISKKINLNSVDLENRPLIDTLGRILSEIKYNRGIEIDITSEKSRIKRIIWTEVFSKEEIRISEIGENLLNWLKQTIINHNIY